MHEMRYLTTAVSLAGCFAIGLSMSGCAADNEEPVAATQTYTPPPPMPELPRVTPIRDLMAEMRIDERIIFPEDRAPNNDPARRALLEFFDGFARGQSNAVQRMVEGLDRRELDAMVKTGQWRSSTEGIVTIEIMQTGQAGSSSMPMAGNPHRELFSKSAVELQRLVDSGEFQEMAKSLGLRDDQIEQIAGLVGTPGWDGLVTDAMQSLAAAPTTASPTLYAGEECVLALFIVDGREQVQLWYYEQAGDRFVFRSAPTPPNMINRLSGTNWIKSWHDIIDREMMLAFQPDERIAPRQQRLDDGDDSSSPSSGPSGPAGPRAPSLPPPPQIEVPKGPGFGG